LLLDCVLDQGIAVHKKMPMSVDRATMMARKARLADAVLPGLTAIAGAAAMVVWLQAKPPQNVQARLPGMDRPAAKVNNEPAAAALPGRSGLAALGVVRGPGAPSSVPGSWPGFRGPQRDAISTDATPLARSWPPTGPPVLWSVTLGEGYAGAAIQDGRVYVLDYDEPAQADTLRCLSLDDGREIWRNSYAVTLTRNHGISRTVPAIAGRYVITLGPRGHLAGWDAESGACLWLTDLVEKHSAKVPLWYIGQCPLIDQDRLIVATCGPAMLVALDYRTGQVLWESPNPRGWTMTHSSIVPLEFAGRRMYVYCGSGGVAGIAAEDGALLWDSTEWTEQFATAPSPVALPNGRIFLCSGYASDTGSLFLQLHASGGKITAETAQALTPREFNAEQHTPIFRDGCLYGIRKRGRGQLVCLDLEGQEIWNSGREHFGHGPFLFADGMLLLLDDDGVLTLAEANPSGFQVLSQHQVIPDGREAWGPMALVDGRLIVRDLTRMVCVDLVEHP
jgi:outer membrane protein assembly factor BamB